MPRYVMVLALLVSGVVQALESPPLNWFWLTAVSWVPALWVFTRLEGRRAFLAGWLCGMAGNAAIFYWIVHTVRNFTNLPTPVALVVLVGYAAVWSAYLGVFAWGLGPLRRAAGLWWPVAAALWFTAAEFLNPQLFPYYQGSTWYQFSEFFLVTTVTGVSFITFWLLLVNAVIVDALQRRRVGASPGKPWAVQVALAVVLAGAALGTSWQRERVIERAEAEAEVVQVAVIQSNQTVFGRRAMIRKDPHSIANDWIALSEEALKAHPDIDVLVFPEGALLGSAGARVNWRVRRFARDHGVEIWAGGSAREGHGEDRRVFNAGYRIDAEGSVDPPYYKTVLLPFGEFMPFEDMLPILKKIQGPGAFTRGGGPMVFDSAEGRFMFLICYEAIRSEYVRGGLEGGVDLLVNITYDAWFGDTSNPTQHLMLSAIQAAQYGLPLVRAATTGISAFVDARGRLVSQTQVFERTYLVRDVKKVRLPTFYGAHGDWFPWSATVLSLLLVGWGYWQRRRDDLPSGGHAQRSEP